MELINFFIRIVILILFESIIFFIPNLIKLDTRKYFPKKILLGLSAFIGLFYFLYIDVFVHNLNPRIEGDTISLISLYIQGKPYINAQGSSFFIIFVINLFSCCFSAEATITYVFMLILPPVTFLLIYYVIEQFSNSFNAYFASILFIQFDLIINQFTLNVKQHLAMLFILVTILVIIRGKKLLETNFNKKSLYYYYYLLVFILSFITFYLHLISYFISLIIIPIILDEFTYTNKHISRKISLSSFIWILPSFFYPLIYGFQSSHFGVFTDIISDLPLINILLDFDQYFDLILFLLYIILIVALFLFPYFVSFGLALYYNNNIFFDQIKAKYFFVSLITASFFFYILFITPEFIFVLFKSQWNYVFLSLPKLFFIGFTSYLILNYQFIAKTLMNRDEPTKKEPLPNDSNFRLISFYFMGFTLFVLYGLALSVDFLLIDGGGQWSRRILDYIWIPYAIIISLAITYFKSYKQKEKVIFAIFLFTTIPMFLLGSADPFLMYSAAW